MCSIINSVRVFTNSVHHCNHTFPFASIIGPTLAQLSLSLQVRQLSILNPYKWPIWECVRVTIGGWISLNWRSPPFSRIEVLIRWFNYTRDFVIGGLLNGPSLLWALAGHGISSTLLNKWSQKEIGFILTLAVKNICRF